MSLLLSLNHSSTHSSILEAHGLPPARATIVGASAFEKRRREIANGTTSVSNSVRVLSTNFL